MAYSPLSVAVAMLSVNPKELYCNHGQQKKKNNENDIIIVSTEIF